jgi:hypothetical protein
MNTTTAREELDKMKLDSAIKNMNKYASIRLHNIDVKQFEGKTPDDFVSEVLLKILEGDNAPKRKEGEKKKKVNGQYNWQESATTSFSKFLMNCVSTEVYNFMKGVCRRTYSISSPDEYGFEFDRTKYNYEMRDENEGERTYEYTISDII